METRADQLKSYDPSSVGVKGSIFGLPYTEKNADVIILPVPWDVTVSYKEGTANAPAGILNASPQLDLEVFGLKKPWKVGQYMLPVDQGILEKSRILREKARNYMEILESGESGNHQDLLKEINAASEQLNEWLYHLAGKYLEQGKLVASLGGDHSTPLGLIRALGDIHESFAILQIDAHMDLREAYEGFEYSHASIMYNCLKLSAVNKIVQVGIRDYSEEELSHEAVKKGRVKTFFDQEIRECMFHGDSWRDIVLDIVAQLPSKVYISFDIDGIDPKLCPNTGTPVPGGLDLPEINYLLAEIVRQKKKIIGFDLSEVGTSANEWDENVGARVLYNLGVFAGKSNGLLPA